MCVDVYESASVIAETHKVNPQASFFKAVGPETQEKSHLWWQNKQTNVSFCLQNSLMWENKHGHLHLISETPSLDNNPAKKNAACVL